MNKATAGDCLGIDRFPYTDRRPGQDAGVADSGTRLRCWPLSALSQKIGNL